MTITPTDDFGGAVLNCAVRYCLGRRSYMPGLVMDELRPMLPHCSQKTLWCFDRDITEWLAHNPGPTNNDIDLSYAAQWRAFRDEVRKFRGKEPSPT